jgi:hypothetical protein
MFLTGRFPIFTVRQEPAGADSFGPDDQEYELQAERTTGA